MKILGDSFKYCNVLISKKDFWTLTMKITNKLLLQRSVIWKLKDISLLNHYLKSSLKYSLITS